MPKRSKSLRPAMGIKSLKPTTGIEYWYFPSAHDQTRFLMSALLIEDVIHSGLSKRFVAEFNALHAITTEYGLVRPFAFQRDCQAMRAHLDDVLQLETAYFFARSDVAGAQTMIATLARHVKKLQRSLSAVLIKRWKQLSVDQQRSIEVRLSTFVPALYKEVSGRSAMTWAQYGRITSVLNAPLKFIRNWNGAAADLGFRIEKDRTSVDPRLGRSLT
jgi:hypothetical protein